MPRRRSNRSDWEEQIDWDIEEEPYRDYGWEAGESGLPEFRDPSVHLTPWEMDQVRHWWGPEEASRRKYISGYNSRQRGRGRGRSRRGQTEFDRGYGYGYSIPEGEYMEGDEYIPGPFSGLGPQGYQRSDESILEDVCERLTQHGYIDASRLTVDVDNGEVTLEGDVDDRRAKRMAEDLVDSIPGVYDVHNRLKINPESSQFRNASGRREDVRGSGVYPASGPWPRGNADVEGMAEWGQGERGAKGYYDHGESEVQNLKDDVVPDEEE